MKKYKKGISLIVLVITVIVLAILATTVIISLSNANIIGQASDTVNNNNFAAYKEQAALAYADWVMDNKGEVLTDITELKEHGFDSTTLPSKYEAYVDNGIVEIVEVNVWDGTIATNYADGTGTEADPYQISTGAELAYLAKTVNDGGSVKNNYFILTANIDLNNIEWTPIGFNNSVSNCYFEGNNYTIFNIIVDSEKDGGLFGNLYNGRVLNLTLCKGNITATRYAGALCGYANAPGLRNIKNIGVFVNGGTDNYRLCGVHYTGWY